MKKSSNGLLFSLVIVIAGSLLAAGVGYVYEKNKQANKPVVATSTAQTQNVAQQEALTFPVTVVSPNGGESWVTGQKYLIQWKTPDNDPEAMFVPKEKIKVYLASGGTPICLLTNEPAGFVWFMFRQTCVNENGAEVNLQTGKYSVVVYAYDGNGKLIGKDSSDKEFNLTVNASTGYQEVP